MLMFMIKSYFLSSSYQNQMFYSDSLYHTYQYMGDYKLIYIFIIFLHFCMFFQYFYLEKYRLGNLIKITSNSLHVYIVSYPSVCLWLQVDIFLHFGVFLSVFT